MNIRSSCLAGILALLCDVPARTGEEAGWEEECRAFARKIEEGINRRDPKALDDVVDMEGLLDRATSGTGADEKFRQGFVKGVSKTVNLGANIVGALGEDGSYKLLRVKLAGGNRTALFRMLSAQGVNYHDFTVEKDPKGNLRITEVFVYLTGEPLGQTLRRFFLQASAGQGGMLGKLLGWENDVVKNAGKLKEITEATQAGNAARAKKLYEGLPASMRKDRTVLVQRTQWAARLSEKEQVAAFAAIRKAFPDDPSMQFIGIDGLFLEKKFDEGVKVIDRLIESLGPDAHLTMLKGNFLMEKGDLAGAAACDRKAVEMEPDLLPPHWALLTVLLRQKDYPAAKDLMLAMEHRKLVVFDALEGNEEYSGFVKSPEYEKFKKERPERGPGAAKPPDPE